MDILVAAGAVGLKAGDDNPAMLVESHLLAALDARANQQIVEIAFVDLPVCQSRGITDA